MIINFAENYILMNDNKMPDHSRVWIYQADREFTENEMHLLKNKVSQFVEGWTSHSKLVSAAFEIRYNRFLILLLDESQVAAGGCSIDSSVHFIKSLESEFQNPLTDRMKFTYRLGDRIESVSKNEFEKLLDEGKISDNTIVFNNLVSSRQQLDSGWEIPFSQSWHKNFFGSRV
jgi:hypothetical protein